jgi:uncharacterized membrane protein
MMWFLIAAFSQVLSAFTVLIDKYLIEKHLRLPEQGNVGAYVLLIYSTLFSLLAAPILFFWDMHGALAFRLDEVGVLVVAGMATALWIGFYLLALFDDDATRVQPLFQFVPLLGIVGGALFLGEVLTHMQVLGVVVITLGAVVLAYEEGGAVRWRLLALMSGAVVFSVVADVLFKFAASEHSLIPALFWMHIGLLCAAGVLLVVQNGKYRKAFLGTARSSGTTIFGFNVLNEVIAAVSVGLFSLALLLAPVAMVQSTEAFTPLALFIGSYFIIRFAGNPLKEDVSRRQMLQKLAGVLVVAVGSFLLL